MSDSCIRHHSGGFSGSSLDTRPISAASLRHVFGKFRTYFSSAFGANTTYVSLRGVDEVGKVWCIGIETNRLNTTKGTRRRPGIDPLMELGRQAWH